MTAAELDALIARFPEINLCDYSEDDVAALNQWGTEAADAIRELRRDTEICICPPHEHRKNCPRARKGFQ